MSILAALGSSAVEGFWRRGSLANSVGCRYLTPIVDGPVSELVLLEPVKHTHRRVDIDERTVVLSQMDVQVEHLISPVRAATLTTGRYIRSGPTRNGIARMGL